MPDQYLTLAEEVLHIHGRPLSAQQILSEAKRYGLLPDHLHGATQHKTLQARISDNIQAKRSLSRFYRVGVGRYFLRELADDPTLPTGMVREQSFSGRIEKIDVNRLLLADTKSDIQNWEGNPNQAIKSIRNNNRFEYPKFPLENQILIGTVTIILRDGYILLHDFGRFSWFYDRLEKKGSCIGFRRYISEYDDDIFSEMDFGIDLSSSREVLRNLSLTEGHEHIDDRDIRRKLSVKGLCLEDKTQSAFFVVVVKLGDFGNSKLNFKGRKDVRQLRWIEISKIVNEDFDGLSTRIASSGMLNDIYSK